MYSNLENRFRSVVLSVLYPKRNHKTCFCYINYIHFIIFIYYIYDIYLDLFFFKRDNWHWIVFYVPAFCWLTIEMVAMFNQTPIAGQKTCFFSLHNGKEFAIGRILCPRLVQFPWRHLFITGWKTCFFHNREEFVLGRILHPFLVLAPPRVGAVGELSVSLLFNKNTCW